MSIVPKSRFQDVPLPKEIKTRERGRLPHWEADSATYFVTFRLGDSLPQHALRLLQFQRQEILDRINQPRHKVSGAERSQLTALFTDQVEAHLDAGSGACHLASPRIAEMVFKALWYFHGSRYTMFARTLMPNHVHVVFRPARGFALHEIIHSWKSFTAKLANEMLGTKGSFWQREYYDHMIRDADDFERVILYTLNNPKKAGLTDWPWVSALE